MTITPYGTWPSPISAGLIASDAAGLGEPRLDGDDCYWLEQRPTEGGRSVLVRHGSDGVNRDITPAGFNVRTRVHEYGGGAYTVAAGSVFFVNFADQRVYRQTGASGGYPLTPLAALRYADFAVDATRQRLIAVREDHSASDAEPINTLVSLDSHNEAANADGGRVLTGGDDFYSSPRLSPDGTQLAWLSWKHPDMPWDSTTLWLASIAADGGLHAPMRVAGGAAESVCQPQWSPDGVLHFISDRSGWWNLYRHEHGQCRPLCERAADFAMPHWVFAQSTYAFLSADTLLCAYTEGGAWQLARLDCRSGACTPLTTPYSEFHGLRATAGRVLCSVGAPNLDTAIAWLDPETGTAEVLRRASHSALDPGMLSLPRTITFPSANQRTAHALYYAPRNSACTAPPDELPPLIVRGHGGPTSMASTALNLGIQFWTSRGFAVLDVNYAGSSGFGRAYRDALNGLWGVVDVEDCVYGARHLVAQGLADPARLAIRGGSAGGYTALCALTFHDVFKAGTSLYGVSDLEALARDTHKFESRYLDRLVGPYPAARATYRARSPIDHADRLNAPVIFLQGSEDKVVPPDQARCLVDALRNKGLPVAYLLFDGEGHGFRQAANITRALEAELYFYGKVFGFTPADPLPPLTIDNLPSETL